MPVVRMRMKQIRTPNLSAEKARERKNDECSMFLCLDKFRQKKMKQEQRLHFRSLDQIPSRIPIVRIGSKNI